MQKHIDDMMNGEHIILVTASRHDASTFIWNIWMPAQVIVNVSEMRLTDPASGGWIQIALPTMWWPEKLRGILADVRYMAGAEHLVSSEFLEIARERSDRYAHHRKSKPLHK